MFLYVYVRETETHQLDLYIFLKYTDFCLRTFLHYFYAYLEETYLLDFTFPSSILKTIYYILILKTIYYVCYMIKMTTNVENSLNKTHAR